MEMKTQAEYAAEDKADAFSQFARAFDTWEREYRANPEGFMTAQETADGTVEDASASRARYFMEILDRGN